MRKLSSYTFITLNGMYKAEGDDISWHKHEQEEADMSERMLKLNNTLIFGRVTYEMMAYYWPSAMAQTSNPVVAKGMNDAEKIVISKKLKKAEWNNSRIIHTDMVDEIRKLKKTNGNDLTILGSGSIVNQLAEAGLIDEFQLLIDPIILSKGTPLFQGIKRQLNLNLIGSNVYKSGAVFLAYSAL